MFSYKLNPCGEKPGHVQKYCKNETTALEIRQLFQLFMKDELKEKPSSNYRKDDVQPRLGNNSSYFGWYLTHQVCYIYKSAGRRADTSKAG